MKNCYMEPTVFVEKFLVENVMLFASDFPPEFGEGEGDGQAPGWNTGEKDF